MDLFGAVDVVKVLSRMSRSCGAIGVTREVHRAPVGGGMSRSLQILRTSLKSTSRWRGTAVDLSASKPQ
jgi:hypothetical protein